MAVASVDFISAAERIIAAEDSEIAWRVAASRAYYGAFHCCRDLVERQKSIPVPQNVGEHERYYQAVNALPMTFPGAIDLKKLTYRAKQIRSNRVVADYHLSLSFRREEATQAIVTAREVHALYKAFISTYNV